MILLTEILRGYYDIATWTPRTTTTRCTKKQKVKTTSEREKEASHPEHERTGGREPALVLG